MAIKVSYTKLIDEIKPSLEKLGNIVYKEDTPISHLLNIAENLERIEVNTKSFWSTREKLLEGLVEKDKDGKPKQEVGESGNAEYVLTNENKAKWSVKFQELRETEIEVDLHTIEKKNLEGAKLTALDLKGCFLLLK
tara:strand:+ start:1085 stop:1495 length:411 start_codon:yes stop_codon:yes gene_type:complete